MRTPAGKECPFFYGDYYRGKNSEECRLIGHKPAPQNWTPDLCSTCPIPGIKLANACENLQFRAQIGRKFFFSKRRVLISAFCSKTNTQVAAPEIGCGECHPLNFKKIEISKQ